MMQGYFGTNAPLPAAQTLRAGALTCLYEQGKLRYVKVGQEELVRMIYVAVRDETWYTVSYTIENEQIVSDEHSFHISLTARFHHKHILYLANIEIVGSPSGEITLEMEGVAGSEFQRNRIGLCVLHPIEPTAGQEAGITRPDGSVYRASFPRQISPHQPFLEIQALEWITRQGARAQLSFEGEEFETEDQRNWTDNSFKTYSTPLRLPMPVRVKEGEQHWQKVTLQLNSGPTDEADAAANTLRLEGTPLPFPKIGYTRSLTTPSDARGQLLQKVPVDHIRVEVHMESIQWEANFAGAREEAQRLSTQLELIVFMDRHPWQEVVALIGALQPHTPLISSVLLVGLDTAPVPEGFPTVASVLHNYLPTIPIGYGTNGHFVDLNRNPPRGDDYDFVSFSVNPQAHATDTRTILENAPAQSYVVQTIRALTTKPIHVSPLTMVPRGLAAGADPRQGTELEAAYILLSIRYLGGIERLTITEPVTYLDRDSSGMESVQPTALLKYLNEIKAFAPVYIKHTHSPAPLVWDVLGLVNAAEEEIYYLVNFSPDTQSIKLNATLPAITLSPEQITTYRKP